MAADTTPSGRSPLVSVLLPVYNAMPYLKDALGSVLNQTFRDIEVIALDDASTDGSLDYLRSVSDPRLAVVARPKSGYAVNLNVGLQLARADLIARMDADDVSWPERLEKQYALMQARSDVVVCGCQWREIDPGGTPGTTSTFQQADHLIRFSLLLYTPFPHPGAVMRKAAVAAVGGWREDLVPTEDYELWWQLAPKGKFANLPDVLLDYRVHPASISVRRREDQKAKAARISTAHLLARGYARTEAEAEGFRRVMRGEVAGYTADVPAFVAVVDRFLAALERDGTADRGAVEEIRTIARWKLVATARGFRGLGRYRGLWHALRLRNGGLGRALAAPLRRLFAGRAAGRDQKP